jgi:hypothetical protein
MSKSWGPSTWYLFHTLAEKIKEEHFIELKSEIISIIKKICSNLPCPECASHASNKLGSLKITGIHSKEDLKNVLLSFHNFVNIKTKKPEWNESQLNDKYVLANTHLVIQYFIQTWSKPNPNPRLITHNFYKSMIIKEFLAWWNIHNSKFNP